MSIGDALADARRQAGLTVTQVSKRTCIRETIIRSIERGDFSGCGGDFYARGHIRSIAGVVGANPAPLIQEYDRTLGSPHAITAADVFQPVTPVRLRERRRPNWTAALAAALVLVIGGFFLLRHFSGTSATTGANQAAKVHHSVPARPTGPTTSASPAAHTVPRRLHIRLTATQNCWVQLKRVHGRTIFAGMVYSGTSLNWIERHDVFMTIGNPAAVHVTVNGKNKIRPGTVRTTTLKLHVGKA